MNAVTASYIKILCRQLLETVVKSITEEHCHIKSGICHLFIISSTYHLIIIHSFINALFCPSPLLLSMHPSFHLPISLILHPSTHLSIPHCIAPRLPSTPLHPSFPQIISISLCQYKPSFQHPHFLIHPYFLRPLSSECKQCFFVFLNLSTW